MDPPDYPHLHGWTPIALHGGPEPAVEWADLRGHAFTGTFFSRILDDWRAGTPPPTIRTGLSALAALDGQPSLEPDLIIAHPSRCGSTLLARLAAASDETILLSEPAVLQQLLTLKLRRPFERPVAELLRAIVRALGRVRFGPERRCVLKLNSQTARFLPVVHSAFPTTPVIWLQRQPAEIVASNIARPVVRTSSPDEAASAALRRATLAFMAATAFVDEQVHVLDYRDLPDAAWTRVATLMGIDPTAADVARMRALAEVDAHSGERFARRPRRPLPAAVQAIVRETLDPMYDALARRGRTA
jgi:hypothetical protein